MNKNPNRYLIFSIYLVLALSTFAVYWPVGGYQFIEYDDTLYVKNNEHVLKGLTREGLIWAFSSSHAYNWHPLTWFSHMLDCQLFGDDPGWHHLTSLWLHIANTLLLFAVFRKMTATLWQSAFVAAAFALHPLHVESVAWIAERKDVLSTFFWLLTMMAYVSYAKRPAVSKYMFTLLLFILGLMAKPMLVTLPFVLLLLDYWPLQRFENIGKPFYRLVREKIPFFTLSIASSIITFWVQQSTGAVIKIDVLPLDLRLTNIGTSYIRYIGKMLWPTRLAVFYPYSMEKSQIWYGLAAVLLLLGISVWVVCLARKHKYLLVGWFWFVGTLVPVIGLVQVGSQSIADRYTYIPFIGLFVVIAFGCCRFFEHAKYKKIVFTASSLVILVTWLIVSGIQLKNWRNNYSLFEHALKVTENNFVAHQYFAYSLYIQGRLTESIAHIDKLLEIRPNNTKARQLRNMMQQKLQSESPKRMNDSGKFD